MLSLGLLEAHSKTSLVRAPMTPSPAFVLHVLRPAREKPGVASAVYFIIV